MQLLDMPTYGRAMALYNSRRGHRRGPGRSLPARRLRARLVALPDLRVHHALDPDRSGLPAHGVHPTDVRPRTRARPAAPIHRRRELLGPPGKGGGAPPGGGGGARAATQDLEVLINRGCPSTMLRMVPLPL